MNFENMTTEDLVRSAHRLQVSRDRLNDELATMKRELRSRLTKPQQLTFGMSRIIVEENKRFNPDLAKEVLPPARLKKIMVPTPNSAVAREVLTEDEYASVQKHGERKITIKMVEDDEGGGG